MLHISNPTDLVVADYLTSIGITFHVSYVREMVRDDGWKCDRWTTTFASRNPSSSALLDTDYFTGLGHRVNPKFDLRPHQGYVRPGTLAYEENERLKKPVPPTAATVLRSLLVEAAALDQPFAEWAADFGYSDDSIKAEATYDQCVQGGHKLRRLFTNEQRAALSNMLQDY